jgi:hypothetical protein
MRFFDGKMRGVSLISHQLRFGYTYMDSSHNFHQATLWEIEK